ncbi:BPTI/Kunitz of serine protease inhibitors [Sparganum proliferum]
MSHKHVPLEHHIDANDLKYIPLERHGEFSPIEESKRTFSEQSEICDLPADGGMCRAFMPRFYFDANDNTCKPFIYGGCGGNKNNFRSELQCLEACASRA